ncbi:Glycosyl transferase family protein (fragment) [Desulfamplus magnetovallimortis]|uniref:Glycosyl transferase family protein n=1 Tax=Desulfamplus magnetovallimortis TaxID=1246637 RepID=A0A1W1HBZ0_9BACT
MSILSVYIEDILLSSIGFFSWGLFVGFLGAFVFAKTLLSVHFMDIPNQRSSHNIPTPKGGGVGIVVSVILACAYLALPLSIQAALVIVALIGIISDFAHFSQLTRLFFHLCTAFIVVF